MDKQNPGKINKVRRAMTESSNTKNADQEKDASNAVVSGAGKNLRKRKVEEHPNEPPAKTSNTTATGSKDNKIPKAGRKRKTQTDESEIPEKCVRVMRSGAKK